MYATDSAILGNWAEEVPSRLESTGDIPRPELSTQPAGSPGTDTALSRAEAQALFGPGVLPAEPMDDATFVPPGQGATQPEIDAVEGDFFARGDSEAGAAVAPRGRAEGSFLRPMALMATVSGFLGLMAGVSAALLSR